MLGAVSVVMETSSGVGCQEQPSKKEKMAAAKCPPPTPNLITQYFKSPPKPEVTSPRPAGIMGYFKPMGKSPAQQLLSKQQVEGNTKAASLNAAPKSKPDKNSLDKEKEKTTTTKLKRVTKAKSKKQGNKETEEVKDQACNQKVDVLESGKDKELKKAGTESSVCSKSENGEGGTMGKRKSKKRKKSDVLNTSVEEFEAQPKKASKVSASAENLTTCQDSETLEGNKKTKLLTKTEDSVVEIRSTADNDRSQDAPQEEKDTKQSSEEERNDVGGDNCSKIAGETLIDSSERSNHNDPGDDSVLMISYQDYLADSQSEEEDDVVMTTITDQSKDGAEDSNNVEAEISYSDFLKGGAKEVKSNHNTALVSKNVKDVDESSKQEIPYEDFIKNMASNTSEVDAPANSVSESTGELLTGSPNSSGQGKVVTIQAQVHSPENKNILQQKSSRLFKEGERESSPKTKGRKKSNVVVEEVDLIIEESNGNNKKADEGKAKEKEKSCTEVDPETRAREREIRIQNSKNFMANFRQPGAKKKTTETEKKNDEATKEQENEKQKDEDEKVGKKKSSVKSLQPAAKTNTRARKPAKQVSVEKKDEKKETPMKKNKKADKKNANSTTAKDTTAAKRKKKTENKTTKKKKEKETAKATESEETAQPKAEETPARTTRSGRKCVYRSQLLSMGSPNTPSPIRLRLTRVTRRSQGKLDNQEDITPKSKTKAKNVKVTKAQELVQKAKAQKSNKAKAKSGSSLQPKVTRPKTQAAKTRSPEVVEIVDERKTSTPQSKRVQPRKGASKVQSTKGKEVVVTPKKEAKVGKDGKPLRSFLDVLGKKKVASPGKRVCSPRKAAPLFSMFGKKVADGNIRCSPVTILDEDSRGSGSENSMDEATFAARRNFLMSGIPDRLRKQITISAAQALAYMYPPFPTVSHVQQRETDICDGRPDFWTLPPPTEGRIPTVEVQTDWNFEGKVWKNGLQLGAITTCIHTVVSERKPRTPAPPLAYAVCKSLVAEIGTHCPGVPVRRVYKRYRARYLEHQGHEHHEQVPSVTIVSHPIVSKEPPALKDKKSNKRKLSEVTEGQDHNTNKRKKTEEEAEGQKDSPEGQEPRRRSRLSRKAKMADKDKGQESNVSHESEGEGRRRSGRIRRNSSSGGEKEEPRRSSRKASKNQEKDKKEESEEEMKIVEKDASGNAETNQDGIQDSLWTDKYQPRSSSEVIGNTGAMKKLKGWLQDWKIRADKEMRRLMKEMKKQKQAQKKAAKKSGSQGSGDWWDDDDSDFDLSDDGDSDYNEEEEEDGLCNTMLVLGPTGIGKTSAVYACAQELGYKVFEVNAASLRSGKQVLTQLREATQSHQVSKQAQTGGAASLFKTSLTPQKVKPGATKGSLPSSFASFFKKTEDGKKEDDSKGPAGKNKVRRSLELEPASGAKGNKKEKKTESRRSSKGSGDKKFLRKSEEAKTAVKKEPTMAMTSLILFEEVDVVFEEDKGFLTAINSLMTTTKRPIILTTSDATFSARFEGRYEELTFKQPLQPVVTSHLQLLCLAENLPTKRTDIDATVALCRGDIRHAMLSVQFWVESGGGSPEKRTTDLHKAATNTAEALQPANIEESSQSQTWDNGENTIKPNDKTTMVLGPLPDDEDAMDANSFASLRKTTELLGTKVLPPVDDTCDSCPSSQEVVMDTSPGTEAVNMYTQCMESVLGIHNIAGCNNQVLEMLKTQDSDQESLARQISLTASCQWLGRNLLFYNVEQLLPLPTTPWIRPKCSNSGVPQNVPLDEEGVKQRKSNPLLDSSLFDAEDLPSSQPKDAATDKDKKQPQTVTDIRAKSSSDETVDSMSTSTVEEKEENVLKQRLICQALASFCELSENKSFLDSHIHRRSLQKEGLCKTDQSAWRAKVKSGLTDSVRTVEESDWRRAEMEAELRAAVEVTSVRQCARTVGKLAAEYAQDSGSDEICEELTLPVVGDAASLKAINLQEETQAQLSMYSTKRQTVQAVMTALPTLTHGQHRAISLDYLPTLRSICATEKLREASKLKRRFLHYLDNNGVSLKPSVLNSLAQEF